MPRSPDRLVGRRSALVIATGTYGDARLGALRSPSADAEQLAAVLADPLFGAYSVHLMLDSSVQALRLAIERFLSGREAQEAVLVYLSCHGILNAHRRLYFATSDTNRDELASTAVEARWLIELLDDCQARRQVVLLDCCFSGAFALTKAGRAPQKVALHEEFAGEEGRGRAVLTASRDTEYSFEGELLANGEVSGSVFTTALVEGLRSGAADIDHDGYVSVDDAYVYVSDQVKAAGAPQTPQRWLYRAEGRSLLLTRSSAGTDVSSLPLAVVPAATVDALAVGSDRRAGRSPGRFPLTRRRAAGLAVGAVGFAVAGGAWVLVQSLAQGSGATGGKDGTPSSTGGDGGLAASANVGAEYGIGNRETLCVFGGERSVVALDAATGAVRWKTQTDANPSSQPVAGDGILYVVTDDGVLSLDAVTGAIRWSKTIDGAFSPPIVHGGTLYLTTTNANDTAGSVVAMDIAAGAVRWTRPLSGVVPDPVVVGDAIFAAVSTSDDSSSPVVAVDAVTGVVRWTRRLAGGGASLPAVGGDMVYFVTINGAVSGSLFALGTADGAVRWTYQTNGDIASSPVVAGSRVYAITNEAVVALDAVTGVVQWASQVSGTVPSALAVVDGTVYVSTGSRMPTDSPGSVYAVDGATGTVLWSRQTSGPVSSPAAVVGNIVCADTSGSLMDTPGHIYAMDAATGAVLWNRQTDGPVAPSPVLAERTVYASAGGHLGNNSVVAVDTATGAVRWTYKTPPFGSSLSPTIWPS